MLNGLVSGYSDDEDDADQSPVASELHRPNPSSAANPIAGLVSYGADDDENSSDDGAPLSGLPTAGSETNKRSHLGKGEEESMQKRQKSTDPVTSVQRHLSVPSRDPLASTLIHHRPRTITQSAATSQQFKSTHEASPHAISTLPGCFLDTTDVQLPPSPTGVVSQQILAAVDKLSALRERNHYFNASLEKTKNFSNPTIYEKLIEVCEVVEMGSNLPLELYNPKQFSTEFHYHQLSEKQRLFMESREAAFRARQTVAFVPQSAPVATATKPPPPHLAEAIEKAKRAAEKFGKK